MGLSFSKTTTLIERFDTDFELLRFMKPRYQEAFRVYHMHWNLSWMERALLPVCKCENPYRQGIQTAVTAVDGHFYPP